MRLTIAITATIAALITTLTGCATTPGAPVAEPSAAPTTSALTDDQQADIREAHAVRALMQHSLDTDKRFAYYHLFVANANLVRTEPNVYKGSADIRGPGDGQHFVPIEDDWDGVQGEWHTTGDGFNWLNNPPQN